MAWQLYAGILQCALRRIKLSSEQLSPDSNEDKGEDNSYWHESFYTLLFMFKNFHGFLGRMSRRRGLKPAGTSWAAGRHAVPPAFRPREPETRAEARGHQLGRRAPRSTAGL